MSLDQLGEVVDNQILMAENMADIKVLMVQEEAHLNLLKKKAGVAARANLINHHQEKEVSIRDSNQVQEELGITITRIMELRVTKTLGKLVALVIGISNQTMVVKHMVMMVGLMILISTLITEIQAFLGDNSLQNSTVFKSTTTKICKK